MKPFAGTIKPKSSSFANEKNDAFLGTLSRKFPSTFAGASRISTGCMDVIGDFESHVANGVTVIFNGELFNRKELATITSTPANATNAVLVHELMMTNGTEAVKRINGQFTIIRYDESQNTISIINDHLGVQQVLYFSDNEVFVFGSEAKLIQAHALCAGGVDWETALKRPQPHVVLGSYKSYKTWFKDISLLPEACIMAINLQTGRQHMKIYWRPQDIAPAAHDSRTTEQVMEEYAALLEDAVKVRMAASGPTYSLLSGGLDSSAICGLAAKNGPIETFSIINQTTVLEDTTSFCYKMAGEMKFSSAQFLVPYHELCFNPELWKQRVWRAESPVNHTDSLTKTLLHYAIRKNNPAVTALLTGTGSDQLNGGLVNYIVAPADTAEESWTSFENAILDVESALLINRHEEPLWQMRKFVNRDYLSAISGIPVEENPWQIYMDGATHSEAFSLLWDEQRASASHGHVTYYPFLDYRIVEFTAAIPVHLHKHLFYDKQILRGPAKKFLPDYIINKPKKPYDLPEYDFRAELYESLTQDNEQSLFTAAFGDVEVAHPVIDKKQLYSRIQAMREKPEIMEWLNIMHIINLGLLEQLSDKEEQDLNYESTLETPAHIKFDESGTALELLRKRLGVLSNNELIDKPLKFGENCSLLLDTKSNKYYLSKRNNLTYELDDDCAEWKRFLTAIDNKLSTRQILEETGISFQAIEEFFIISLKELILVTGDKQIGY